MYIVERESPINHLGTSFISELVKLVMCSNSTLLKFNLQLVGNIHINRIMIVCNSSEKTFFVFQVRDNNRYYVNLKAEGIGEV